MSRLAKLMQSTPETEGTQNGKTEIKAQQSTSKTEARSPSEKPADKRARLRQSAGVDKPANSLASETRADMGIAPTNANGDVTYPSPAEQNEAPKAVAAISRLSTLGLNAEEPPRKRELSTDERIRDFQEAIIALDKMVDENAPELRKGISDIGQRIQADEHLQDYLYAEPEDMGKIIRAIHKQYSLRHRKTSERAQKSADKKKEVQALTKHFDF